MYAAVTIALGIMGPLLLLEVVLWFLPVSTGMLVMPVNEREPVYRYEPNQKFRFSRDWNFSLVHQGWINNDGFINDQAYTASDSSPVLAIVGDSYIEAAMVPYDSTVQGRLARRLRGTARVYSFAASGAPLSQYLIWAEHARDAYGADGLVISVVGNDFDESLLRYKSDPGFHYFEELPDGTLTLKRINHSISSIRRLIGKSALVRYAYLNLRLPRLLQRPEELTGGGTARYVGNTEAAANPERLAASRRAVQEFLRELPDRSGLDPRHIVFVVDGMRPHLYSSAGMRLAKGSFVDLMRRYFMDQARERGYEVIDMQPRFLARYARDSVRFEFPTDSHWNSVGHDEVADAVAESRVLARVLVEACCRQPSGSMAKGDSASRRTGGIIGHPIE